MNDEDRAFRLNRSGITRAMNRLIALPFLGLMVLFVAAGIWLIQRANDPRYWLMLAGSVLSVTFWIAFVNLVTDEMGKAKRGLIPMLSSFGLFIPYLFGCYLFFYEGLWRLFGLTRGFSIRLLVFSLLFILLGYKAVKATYKITEFAKSIGKGVIVVGEEQEK